MSSRDYLTLGLGAVTIALWIVGLARGWPELIYERKKEDTVIWYWLTVFRIPRTRENCVGFVRGCSGVGIVLVAAGTLLLVFGQ